MRLLICAGGTGGGVYPALAVLDALQGKADPILWVGSQTGMEKILIERAGLPFSAIPAAGLHGVGLPSLPGNIRQLLRGFKASQAILRRFQPDVLLFTGGYVAVPMALAARHYPSVLYVPDIEPGLALRTLAHLATHIALTTEESRQYFRPSANTTVTGYPIRPELLGFDAPKARKTLGLSEEHPVLLVFGGSKGARSINQAVLACLPELLRLAQVVHITGPADWQAACDGSARLPQDLKARYHGFSYLHEEMGAALASADLVLCRAGASTLGDLPHFGLPAVLVPYPYAWRYQKVNADYLANRGAAIVLKDEDMSTHLLETLAGLLGAPERLSGMQRAMLALARKDAAGSIARIVMQSAKARNHA